MEISRPVNAGVYSLVIDSELNLIAGMGTGNGVHLSNNNGETWQAIGLNNLSKYSLHIHQNGNIFAGTGGSYNIHRLINIGEGWMPVFSGSPNIVSLGNNSQGDIFAGSGHEYGLMRSSNNGDDWEQLVTLSSTEQTNAILSISPNKVFIGTTDFMGGGGVYRSFDNGDTWEFAGLSNYFITSFATNSQGTLFAGSIGGSGVGIYSSDDNGETWAGLKNDVFVTSIVVTPEDVIYIGCSNEHGTQGGVFRSFDNGETWEMINTGLIGWENQNVYGLTLSPDGYLYAYGRHLHRSVEPVFLSNSIQQPNDFETTIYPNPFTSNLNISLSHNYIDSKNTIVIIYDVLGNIVIKQRLRGYSNHFTINTEFLKTGFYFLSIEANGKRYSKSIIKISR